MDEMKTSLQTEVNIAGVTVDNVFLTDLNYAHEIAQQMLIKQQAEAYIEAKSAISKASVDIVDDIVKKVGSDLSDKDKSELIKYLLTVIASGNSVQPTLPMN